MVREALELSYRGARKLAVAVVGGSIVIIGIAMVFLPGPAFVVIPLGLAILGVEFAWARRWLRHVKERATSAFAANRREEPAGSDPERPAA